MHNLREQSHIEVTPFPERTTFWVKTKDWEQFCFDVTELGEMVAAAINEGLRYEVETLPF